ncbi:Kelch repeat type 1, partial [Arabidopsis suecica]
MVVISETSDDGSNGGDHQNKKLKEEENRIKNLKEKVKVSLPIPEELILRCFLLVRRCHHPSLSLVCNSFLRLMPKLYDDRLRLGYTESVLYAYIVLLPSDENPSWYILHRKPYRNLPNTISLRLCKLDILPRPPMLWGCAMVTIGSDIYLIGGKVGKERSSDMILIDCKSHKYRSLPRMKVARCLAAAGVDRFRAAAGVIDGKIYVIGGCKTWSSVPGPYPKAYGSGEFLTYAVMKEKIYCLDLCRNVHSYDPKESKWDSWVSNALSSFWNESSCVIDNLLFCKNTIVRFHGWRPVIIYDPELKIWFFLEGLQGFPENIFLDECKMANFGGKLVILGADVSRIRGNDGRKREIWCIEIAWERKENGRFWGKVESVAVVLTPTKTSSVD